ncbi:MAG: prenyltransferase/squalene oxidase repeat-containing protein [Candidatus Acidiferrum sp.]
MTHRKLVPFCLLLLAPFNRAESPATSATIAYARQLQVHKSGFRPSASQPKPSLRATLGALRVLKYCGGTPPDKNATAAFVQSCFDRESGGFADVPGGKPNVFTTSVGAMVLVELGLPTKEYESAILKYLGRNVKGFEDTRIAAAGLEALGQRPPEAVQWLDQLKKLRQRDGRYGEGNGGARDTGGTVVAIMRLGGKVTHEKEILGTLDASQKRDGGFGRDETDISDLDTSYRVMRCYHMLKAKPDAAGLFAFIERCHNTDGGYGVAPGQPSNIGATYNAAIIRHWLAERSVPPSVPRP